MRLELDLHFQGAILEPEDREGGCEGGREGGGGKGDKEGKGRPLMME